MPSSGLAVPSVPTVPDAPPVPAARRGPAALWSYRPFRLAVVFLAWFHLGVQLLVAVPGIWERTDQRRDSVGYHVTLERLDAGEPLYRPWPGYGPHLLTEYHGLPATRSYVYPPFLAAGLALLPRMSWPEFARFWTMLGFAGFWVYALCLARLATGRTTATGVLVAGLVLGLTPGTYDGISLGQVDPLLWALLGVALVVPALRGAGLMASALVKVYCLWPLLAAIRREGRGVALSAAVPVAVGVAVGTLALGPGGFVRACLDWFRYALPIVGQGYFDPHNLSLSYLGLHAARALGWEYVAGPFPLAARLWLTGVGIAAPLAVGWLLRRREPALQYAAMACAAVLFGPVVWMSYLPLLLAPAAVLLGAWTAGSTPSPARRRVEAGT